MLKYIIFNLFIIAFSMSAIAQVSNPVQTQEESQTQTVFAFMSQNSDRVSLVLLHNGRVVADQQPRNPLPLASTVKMLLALDVAHLGAVGQLDLNETVSLRELERFHLPGTDGGAHAAWLNSMPETESSGKVRLLDVALGMTKFSSNANTEYIIRRLGRNRVETLGEIYGLKPHAALYPLVGALFIPYSLPGSFKDHPSQLRALDEQTYRELAWSWSDSLAADTSAHLRQRFKQAGLAVQRVISDRLPSSNAIAYADLAGRLNRRENLSKAEQKTLTTLLEYNMESAGNQAMFSHAGMKGGSSGFLLTKCLYASDHQGQPTELMYFLTDLQPMEVAALKKDMDAFELALLTEETARRQLATLFPPDGD